MVEGQVGLLIVKDTEYVSRVGTEDGGRDQKSCCLKSDMEDHIIPSMDSRGKPCGRRGGGGLVYESALFRAPESETNAGAALDVLKAEPPRQGNPLLVLPNVVVTLHGAVAGWSEEALYRELKEAGTEIKLVLEGKNRRHPLNPEVLFGS